METPKDWHLSEDGKALERDFKFKDFATAWTFMCRIAAKSEEMNHHPEWSNVYNRVSIRLTTHDAGGLSELDHQLASWINTLD